MIDVELISVAGIGKNNEDFALQVELAPDVCLIIVCDGMGGLAYGSNTSKFVAKTIADYIKSNYSTQSPEQLIINALYYANAELAKECIRLKSKMGTTVALTLLVGNICYYSWLGDVRLYFVKRGKTELLTKDHLAIEGNHSFITRCINGREFRYSPVVTLQTLNSGDTIVIATDGYYLHNKLEEALEPYVIDNDDATVVRIRQVLS